MTAHDDRARDERPVPNVSQCRCPHRTYPQPAILHIWRPALGCPAEAPVQQPRSIADLARAAGASPRNLGDVLMEAGVPEQPAPTARETAADELQPEERACAISPVFRETALRMAEVIDKPYPEVPMALLDEVFCELIERGVIR